jgi:hypothetical protein
VLHLKVTLKSRFEVCKVVSGDSERKSEREDRAEWRLSSWRADLHYARGQQQHRMATMLGRRGSHVTHTVDRTKINGTPVISHAVL